MEALAPGRLAVFEQQIKDAIGQPRFELWFSGNTQLEYSEGMLEIGVPNRFYREWLESHFQQEIKEAAERVFGRGSAVRFRIDPTLFRRVHAQLPAEPAAAPSKVEPPHPVRPSRFALDRFIVGPSNRVAHAAASAIVESPRSGYSPLFIYGGVGLGKTHLLKGIEEGLRRSQPQLAALAMACEEFTNQFVHAMRTSKLGTFRRKMRSLDVLLLDDVQFLCKKRGTQEEFFHTMNALHVRGAKVVLGCDVHPRRLSDFREELVSRFLSGMVAKLDPPNRELRRQIVRSKAAARCLELKPEVIDYLTEQFFSNVCELEGALNYLEHYGETLSIAIDLATAHSALAELTRHSVPPARVADIKKKVGELFGIRPALLAQRSRARSVTFPRMLVLYLARRFTGATYAEIGTEIAGLNHSTVMSAEKRIARAIEKNEEIVLGDRTWKMRDAVEAFARELGRE